MCLACPRLCPEALALGLVSKGRAEGEEVRQVEVLEECEIGDSRGFQLQSDMLRVLECSGGTAAIQAREASGMAPVMTVSKNTRSVQKWHNLGWVSKIEPNGLPDPVETVAWGPCISGSCGSTSQFSCHTQHLWNRSQT